MKNTQADQPAAASESQAKMMKARDELFGSTSDRQTYGDRINQLYHDVKFLAVACVQHEDLKSAAKLVQISSLMDEIELQSSLDDKPWNGMP